jgi:arsenate reductase
LPRVVGAHYLGFMTPTLYGIPNCDTIKKARIWLDQNGRAYAFHDYKKAGIDRAALEGWVATHGWETVLNRAGTTFRALPEAERTDLNAEKAIALMLAQPSMIKRPVLDLGDRTLVGFKPELYAAAFA